MLGFAILHGPLNRMSLPLCFLETSDRQTSNIFVQQRGSHSH